MSEVLRYRSMAEATGYGLSAIGYIEALLERGIEVDWAPLIWDPARGRYVMTTIRHRSVPELLTPRTRRRLCRARDTEPGTVIAHTIPEYWPELLAAPGPSVGYTMWETDALPGHWPALLELPDRLLVPSRFSASVIEAAGCTTPVVVVPLLPSPAFDLEASVSAERLHRWRSRYGIAADEWVFSTVNEWHPRKALPLLLHAYLLAFTAADPVTLVIKTSARGCGAGRQPVDPAQVVADIRANYPDAAKVCVETRLLPSPEIAELHRVFDCYVSLTRGEGWGMSAFDAVCAGTPVVMTAWGGQSDYLHEDCAYLVDYRLVNVPCHPLLASYSSDQRWAEADLDGAVAALQDVFANPARARRRAGRLRTAVLGEFSRGKIMDRFLAAVG